ncbi:hypothetical protein D6C97_04415 [Aureobasidium pullulans]|uniref:Uncharacterized protein n=1 Tax=Aureobasidium pullulans TaxID=5580 RepID=A0A4S9HGJ9_AURPU|nr:hypothetical protein JADG_006961 [Aureobasidium pullulans]THW32659.1 hypothetical protein D6D21_10307 [Aureobasidium pullulans]THX31632.1 hypothetical protein D6D12_02695 [Aureobasidium pullulans]THX48070.1 hypothetical protein D6D06_09304 [Aureobasidium pullulans]THX55359.1 hypothetical protein D6D11_03872 [Aureobasidium pullulans]
MSPSTIKKATSANRANTSKRLSSRKPFAALERQFTDVITLSRLQAAELRMMREKLRKMAQDMDESEQMSEDVFKVLDSTQTILTSKVAGLAMEKSCMLMLEKFKKDIVKRI